MARRGMGGEVVARLLLLLLLRMSNFACKLPMSGPGLESLSKPQPEGDGRGWISDTQRKRLLATN